MNTVYLKRWLNNGVRFVMVYSDKDAKELKAIINSTTSSLPNKRRKTININCWKYNCEWVT